MYMSMGKNCLHLGVVHPSLIFSRHINVFLELLPEVLGVPISLRWSRRLWARRSRAARANDSPPIGVYKQISAASTVRWSITDDVWLMWSGSCRLRNQPGDRLTLPPPPSPAAAAGIDDGFTRHNGWSIQASFITWIGLECSLLTYCVYSSFRIRKQWTNQLD